jgi:hypothetical protein
VHSRRYWGLKLYLITAPDGMPVAWCLASPKIGEREVAAELLARAALTAALRPWLILIGGKGFAGRDFEDLVTTGYAMSLVRPDRRDETPATGPSAGSANESNRREGPSAWSAPHATTGDLLNVAKLITAGTRYGH